jgi:hypothetical protein
MGAIDLTGTVPRVANRNNSEAFVINHREYVKDIYSGDYVEGSTDSTEFKIESFRLNPANSELFPWLSTIAPNFQEYAITGMLVEYKTMASDLSTTLNLGTVIMTADYNALADPPLTKIAMENMENAGSVKPSMSNIMPIECAKKLTSVSTHLFVGPVDAEVGDARLYDMANIFIASLGIPRDNTVIGELWVTYEIAFYKPKLCQFPASQVNFSFGGEFNAADSEWLKDIGAVLYADNSPLINITWEDPNNGAIHLPAIPGQNFAIFAQWSGTDLAYPVDPAPPSIQSVGISAIEFPDSQTVFTTPNLVVGDGCKTISIFFVCKVLEGYPDPYFYFDPASGTWNNGVLNLFITLWNRNTPLTPVAAPIMSKPVLLFDSKRHVSSEDTSRSESGRVTETRVHLDIEECHNSLQPLQRLVPQTGPVRKYTH